MTTIATLPPPPDPSDSRSVFNAKAFAFWAAMPGMCEDINESNADTNDKAAAASDSAALATTKASEANVSAIAAAANAQTAASAQGAIAWVSGTTYADGDVRWSPADSRVYRRRVGTAGAGSTDPSLDSTNWAAVAPNGLQLAFITGTSGTVGANTDTCFTNPAKCTATLAALGIGEAAIFRCDNGRYDNTLDLGARGFKGPNGQVVTGVMTINSLQPVCLRWWGDYYRSGV